MMCGAQIALYTITFEFSKRTDAKHHPFLVFSSPGLIYPPVGILHTESGPKAQSPRTPSKEPPTRLSSYQKIDTSAHALEMGCSEIPFRDI